MTEGKRTDVENIGTLPVTGEVGSEGGSYADAALQRATRTGDVAAVESTAPTSTVSDAIAPTPAEPEDGVHFTADPQT